MAKTKFEREFDKVVNEDYKRLEGETCVVAVDQDDVTGRYMVRADYPPKRKDPYGLGASACADDLTKAVAMRMAKGLLEGKKLETTYRLV